MEVFAQMWADFIRENYFVFLVKTALLNGAEMGRCQRVSNIKAIQIWYHPLHWHKFGL